MQMDGRSPPSVLQQLTLAARREAVTLGSIPKNFKTPPTGDLVGYFHVKDARFVRICHSKPWWFLSGSICEL